MYQVNIHEAKTQLSKLIQKVMDGEDVVIAKDNEPLVKLVRYSKTKINRIPGSATGLIQIAADFDAPLDDFKDYS